MMTVIWLMSTLFGGDNLESSDRLAPGWVGNAWGPAAAAARDRGDLPEVKLTPSMMLWEDWGRKHLKTGDILFRLGDAKVLRGYFPMSRFLANVSGSVFSHTGIASFEDGKLWIYDTTSLSVRRQPLSVWVLDNIGPFGVKRVKPEYASYIPKAIAYCKARWLEQTPFDYKLGLDDSQLYCIEMCEKAYRNNGLPLSEPVQLGNMENASRYPICVLGFLQFTDLTLDMAVFFPGNERHGIWSSSALMTVVAPPGGVVPYIRKGFLDRTPPYGSAADVAQGTGVPQPPPVPLQPPVGAANDTTSTQPHQAPQASAAAGVTR